MALQLGFTDTCGVEHPAGYWRIVGLSIDVTTASARLEVAVWHDVATRQDDAKPLPHGGAITIRENAMVAGDVILLPPFAAFISQLDGCEQGMRAYCYALLKGLPQFAGAEDV